MSRRTLATTATMVLILTALVATLTAAEVGAYLVNDQGETITWQPPIMTDMTGRPLMTPEGKPIEYPPSDTESEPPPILPATERGVGKDEDTVGLGLENMATANDEFVVLEEWFRAIFGVGIGATGLNVCDLNGDGIQEVVAGASSGGFSANTYWYVLAHGEGGYYQQYVHTPYDTSVGSVQTADVDEDGDFEIIIGLANEIHVYDGQSRELVDTISVAGSSSYSIRSVNVVDVDGDGQLEYVFAKDDDLFVHNVATGAEEYRGSGYGNYSIAVGNVDADPDLEIVTTGTDGQGYVLNGQTRQVEWVYPSGFGFYIRTGDLDGDGMEEIAAGYSWYKIRVLDADVQSPKYDIVTDLDVDAMRLADVEGDGTLELVYGDGQWGDVYVHDGATGTLKWSVHNPRHGVTDVGIGDTDGDGVNELLWGAGYSSTGPDYLYVADTITQETEWQSEDISGPFYALDHGDVDADGLPELLYGCFESESGYGDGLYFVHDALTKALEYQSPEPTGSNWTGLHRIRHANIDDDPQAEIFITTSITYTAMIICYDGITHEEQWRLSTPSGLIFTSMDIADVDGDGQLEIVAATDREHTGAPGTYLYVFDAATGTEEWHSVDLGTYWGSLSLLRVANVDDDENLEMVVAEFYDKLYVYDGVTHIEQVQTPDLDISALDTADLNGDGVAEIIVGRASGAIEIRDGSTGAVTETVGSYGGKIDGLAVQDLTGDGVAELVFAVDGDNELFVYDGTAPTGVPLWRSGDIGSGVGVNDSIMVADIDEDGNTEITVNTGRIGLRVYEIPAEPVMPVAVDIRPKKCPNKVNRKSGGWLPVAILGSELLDVTTIDIGSLLLTREGMDVGVAPARQTSIRDVATPFDGELCACHDLSRDGWPDLLVKFPMRDVVGVLELNTLSRGESVPLTVMGNLLESAGGDALAGSDCVQLVR